MAAGHVNENALYGEEIIDFDHSWTDTLYCKNKKTTMMILLSRCFQC